MHVSNRDKGWMMYFDSESTTSPGNGLCNEARGEANFQKKVKYLLSIFTPSPFLELKLDFRLTMQGGRAMEWRHWSGIDLFFLRSTSPRATLQRPFPREVVIVSRAALKGSEGPEFDTFGLKNIVSALIISHSDDSQACLVMFAPGLKEKMKT